MQIIATVNERERKNTADKTANLFAVAKIATSTGVCLLDLIL